ncbi:hypothetical protein ACJ41O_000586 [Fusarium nematophilum]
MGVLTGQRARQRPRQPKKSKKTEDKNKKDAEAPVVPQQTKATKDAGNHAKTQDKESSKAPKQVKVTKDAETHAKAQDKEPSEDVKEPKLRKDKQFLEASNDDLATLRDAAKHYEQTQAQQAPVEEETPEEVEAKKKAKKLNALRVPLYSPVREMKYSANVHKAFHYLPEYKKRMLVDAYPPFLKFIIDPRDFRVEGGGQLELDVRGALGAMLADPGWHARDIIAHMSDKQANLVLFCTDFSINRLLTRMEKEYAPRGRDYQTDWPMYYGVIKSYQELWDGWKPAEPPEFSVDNYFRYGGEDGQSTKQGKLYIDEICEDVHDFAASGGVANMTELVLGLEDWVATPDYIQEKGLGGLPKSDLLEALGLPESLQSQTNLQHWSPRTLENSFGPALGDLKTVFSFFILALWTTVVRV